MIFEEDLIARRPKPVYKNRETILNLIPQDEPEHPPVEKYTSQYDPHVYAKKKTMGTMGPPKYDVSTQDFQRIKDRTLPPRQKFDYTQDVPLRDRVPLRDEVPIHGLRTKTNYIRTNAAAVIAQPAKQDSHKEVHYSTVRGFGERPQYLDRVQREIEEENAIKNEIKTQRAYQDYLAAQQPERMTEAERQELLAGLKKRWDEIKKTYGQMPLFIDVESMKLNREEMERQMSEIENDMEKLSKKKVYVEKF